MKTLIILSLFLSLNVSAKNWTREEVLNFVNLSPYYVNLHDKAGWVGIFADDAYIEDPVGGYRFHKEVFSSKFQENQVEMFWNAFIAKNNIHFEIKRDIVSGLTVIRDAIVHAEIPEAHATVLTPAHLRYTLKEVHGELKVQSLEAYWHMPSVSGQTLARGKEGFKIMSVQLGNIMNALGTKIGLKHFLKASIVGTHKIGQKAVHRSVEALTLKNESRFLKKFRSDAEIVMNGISTTPRLFFHWNPGLTGLEKVISSGQAVGFNCVFQGKSAVGIATIKLGKIKKLELFSE